MSTTYKIHIPHHPQSPLSTHSTSIARDFREWGYRVDIHIQESESPSPARSPTTNTNTNDTIDVNADILMDLWNAEWLRRFRIARVLGRISLFDDSDSDLACSSSGAGVVSYIGAQSVVGSDNVGQGGRRVEKRCLSGGGGDGAVRTARVRRGGNESGFQNGERSRRWGGLWDFGLMGIMGWGLGVGEIEIVEESVGRRDWVGEEDVLPRYERGVEPPAYQERDQN